jgi:hypothetical protein
MLRRFIAVAMLLGVAMAATVVTTISDIAGDGKAHQVAATGSARWIQFVAPAGNSLTVRIGDVNVSSTRGVPLAAGAGIFMPLVTDGTTSDKSYALNSLYYIVQSGDTLSITYGQ